MKIGIFSDVLNFPRTGIGNYVFHLIHSLNSRYYSHNSICLINYKKTPDFPNPELIIKNPFPINKTYLWYPYSLFKLKKCDLDVIHNPTQVPTIWKSHSKLVMTVHDLTTIVTPKEHSLITRMNERLFLPKTLRNVDMIIADSKNTKKDLINLQNIIEEKIRVIYPGVSPVFQQSKKKPDLDFLPEISRLPYILYVGTIEPRKNIQVLIEAYYFLKREGFPHKLVLAGKIGSYSHDIIRKICSLDLENDIIILDFISLDLLVKLYQNADVFVYPSLYEGFGFPPLEAMACGCPVIVSDSSSLPEVVGDAGILVPPNDVQGFFHAIKSFLQDDSLRNEYVRKGLMRAALFDWQKTADNTWEVYKEVMDS